MKEKFADIIEKNWMMKIANCIIIETPETDILLLVDVLSDCWYWLICLASLNAAFCYQIEEPICNMLVVDSSLRNTEFKAFLMILNKNIF